MVAYQIIKARCHLVAGPLPVAITPGETVTLVVESKSGMELDNVDNMTVAPDGSLYLCEDSGESYLVAVDHQ